MQADESGEAAPTAAAAMSEENVAWMLRLAGGRRVAVIPTLRITFYLPRGCTIQRVYTPRRRRPLPLPSK